MHNESMVQWLEGWHWVRDAGLNLVLNHFIKLCFGKLLCESLDNFKFATGRVKLTSYLWDFYEISILTLPLNWYYVIWTIRIKIDRLEIKEIAQIEVVRFGPSKFDWMVGKSENSKKMV